VRKHREHFTSGGKHSGLSPEENYREGGCGCGCGGGMRGYSCNNGEGSGGNTAQNQLSYFL